MFTKTKFKCTNITIEKNAEPLNTFHRHYPEWDLVKGEPVIELMRVRRELLAADLELQAKREQYQQRRELADHQWQELREKENLLRRSFIRFDEFVRENREKRERAVRKTRNEKERQKIREAEV